MSVFLVSGVVALSVGFGPAVIMAGYVLARARTAIHSPLPSVVFDTQALAIIGRAATGGTIRIIAAEPSTHSVSSRLGPGDAGAATTAAVRRYGQPGMGIFLELTAGPCSTKHRGIPLTVRGAYPSGYPTLSASSTHIGQGIDAVLVGIRAVTGAVPHAEFAWPSRSYAKHLLRFVLYRTGLVAPVARVILRQAEPNPSLRPKVRVS